MTDEQIIEKVLISLKENALGDIRRALRGDSKMGAFILCGCLIEAITGFRKGSDTTRNDYMEFVREYLSEYNAKKLYKDLRCKLVHSYSEGGSYMFTDGKSNLHFKREPSGKTIINLENFIADIEKALKEFDENARDPKNVELRSNVVKRFNKNGIIQVQKITEQNDDPFNNNKIILSGSNI